MSRFCLPLILLIISVVSCKNDTSASVAASDAPALKKGGDVSSMDVLDHDFVIIPEGSKLFVKGFLGGTLANAAITIDKGQLHVKDGILSTADFNLNMESITLVANRDEALEKSLRSEKVFNSGKFPAGRLLIEECIKAVNDQNATHVLKGKLTLLGQTIPLDCKARIDYNPGSLSLNSEQIIVKASDIKIKVADPSQENLYFSLTLNADLPK
jgi:hypothetical protein